MSDDLDVDEMLAESVIAADPRRCPWCGCSYEVAPMLAAAVLLADGTSWQTSGDSMTLSLCHKCGVGVIA